MLQGDLLTGGETLWPSLGKVTFSADQWQAVAPEGRGEHHAKGDYLFVDEVACTNCLSAGGA